MITTAPATERPAPRSAVATKPAGSTASTGPAPATAAPGPMAVRLATFVPQTGPVAELPADVPAVAVDLVGGAPFAAPEPVTDYLAAKGGKAAPVRVRLADVASGTILVQHNRHGFATPGEAWQAVPLLMPVFAPLRRADIEPVLALRIRGGSVEGHASIATKSLKPGSPEKLAEAVQKHADTLGWLGLEHLTLSGVTNKLDGPVLRVGVKNLHFTLGRFLTASGSFEVANGAAVFEATAVGAVDGLGSITVPIKRDTDGSLSGQVTAAVRLKGFSGEVVAAFKGGNVDVQGTAAYANEKFDGKVTIIATDAASAQAIVAGQIPGQPPTAAAAGPSATVAPEAAVSAGPKPGPRVVAGWGHVNAHLADWLGGDALVVVEPTGDVTVIGKITPVMKEPLFPPKDFSVTLFEPPPLRALYGIPVVGNVSLYASAKLTAEARLEPATLTKMEMTGTWSTDPAKLQSFGLTGTLNVSAYAGLRLTLDGGLDIEILSHDIKAGIVVSALAGIKGYVEATPRIGYRELVDPLAGKRGEFFIGGHMELAAQPFLGLSGELYVQLHSPWWSPAPNKRWPWPIGSLEYPLPGSFGIAADVEHVLGSHKIPEISFSKVDFDPEKFLTQLVDGEVPTKSSTDAQKRGGFKDALPPAPGPEAKPPAPPPAKPAAKPVPAKSKVPKTKANVPQPANQERWQRGLGALGELAQRSVTEPFTEDQIVAALKSIRRKFGFTTLTATAAGDVWDVHAEMSPGARVKSIRRKASSAVNFAGTTYGDRGTKVLARPLPWTTYQPPSADPRGWDRLRDHSVWYRGHILNGRTGGPGDAWNLAVIHRDINNVMRSQIEDDLRERVQAGEQLWFEGKVAYYSDDKSDVIARGSDFPKQITIMYGKPGTKTPVRTWTLGAIFPYVTDIVASRRKG